MVGINPTVASHKLNNPQGQAGQIEGEVFSPRLPSNHIGKGRQPIENRLYQGSEVPRVVSQCGGSSKERRKVASTHRLH